MVPSSLAHVFFGVHICAQRPLFSSRVLLDEARFPLSCLGPIPESVFTFACSTAAWLKYEPRAGTPLPGHLLQQKNFEGWRIRQLTVKSLEFLFTHIVTFARATISRIGNTPIRVQPDIYYPALNHQFFSSPCLLTAARHSCPTVHHKLSPSRLYQA